MDKPVDKPTETVQAEEPVKQSEATKPVDATPTEPSKPLEGASAEPVGKPVSDTKPAEVEQQAETEVKPAEPAPAAIRTITTTPFQNLY